MEPDDDQNTPPPEPLSVEERLRRIRETCRLLANVFSIQGEATFLGAEVSMSVDAYNALSTICESCGDDLERLIREIPPSFANWYGEPFTHRV